MLRILFARASNYAARRGFADDKEREAIVDGWLAGWHSGRRKDSRLDAMIETETLIKGTVGELLPAKPWE